jgi:hypothetical protein
LKVTKLGNLFVLKAETEDIGFESVNRPDQIHLPLTGQTGELWVMFVSDDGKQGMVRYGLSSGRWTRWLGLGLGSIRGKICAILKPIIVLGGEIQGEEILGL